MSRAREGATRPNATARTIERAAIAFPLLTLASMFAGCSGASSPAVDAAARADASIVEIGLAFEDAAASDALSYGDAVAQRDGGVPLCRGGCDPVRATGCGSSQLCVLRAEAAECGPPGRGARGAPCESLEECGAGLACFVSETGEGLCDRVCCPGRGDCDGIEVCGGDGLLVDGTASSWGRCVAPRSCTLLEAGACPEREACYVIGPSGESECLLAGSAIEGEPCALPNDCGPDLVCAGASDRVCARLCALGGRDDRCGADAMCVRQAYTPTGVGVCVASASRP